MLFFFLVYYSPFFPFFFGELKKNEFLATGPRRPRFLFLFCFFCLRNQFLLKMCFSAKDAFFQKKKRGLFVLLGINLKKSRFGGSKVLLPLYIAKIVVDAWKDIVIGFNGDPYRGRSRSVPSQEGYKSCKCWTLENVSFLPPPPRGFVMCGSSGV